MRAPRCPAYGRVEEKTLDQEAIHMHKLIVLALVLLAAGALAAWASGGTDRRAGHTSGSSIAAIADASASWAELSSKVPNLQDALTRESRQS
jgi:hypothetical protein